MKTEMAQVTFTRPPYNIREIFRNNRERVSSFESESSWIPQALSTYVWNDLRQSEAILDVSEDQDRVLMKIEDFAFISNTPGYNLSEEEG